MARKSSEQQSSFASASTTATGQTKPIRQLPEVLMRIDKHVELTLRDEEFLIGGILLRPAAIYEAIELISSKDFLSDGFAKVFSTASRMGG